MKMGVGTRIVFTVFLIVIIGVCIFVALAAFGMFPAADVDGLINGFNTSYRYIWAAAAIVIAIVALCLMFFGIKKDEASSVVLVESADGSVSVTLEAIEELAQRHLNEIYGIIVQRIRSREVGPKTVRIDLFLSVKPETEMPAITKTVTEGVKKYVEQYSGILVTYVGIKILPIKQLQRPNR